MIDTNLAILLIVGATDLRLIRGHRRLKAFDDRDYAILDQCLDMAKSIIWCPNVLTETSNLLGRTDDRTGERIAATMKRFIGSYEEQFVPSDAASSRVEFGRLGLTDSVLLILAESRATLLTTDLALHIAAQSAGLSSINFNELRDQRLDFN